MNPFCHVCGDEIAQGEPIMHVAGQIIHRYCSLEGGAVCRDTFCQWWMTDHAGPCVL